MKEREPITLKEKEQITSKIKLHIFRHGAKVKMAGMLDRETPLSDRGRVEAKEKAQIEDISQSVAFGSSRIRTQETAGFVMGGKSNSLSGEETLDELRQKLDKDLSFGSKIGVDEKLDIHDSDTLYDDQTSEILSKEPYLKFLFERSDALAEELGDTKGDTYSRMLLS